MFCSWIFTIHIDYCCNSSYFFFCSTRPTHQFTILILSLKTNTNRKSIYFSLFSSIPFLCCLTYDTHTKPPCRVVIVYSKRTKSKTNMHFMKSSKKNNEIVYNAKFVCAFAINKQNRKKKIIDELRKTRTDNNESKCLFRFMLNLVLHSYAKSKSRTHTHALMRLLTIFHHQSCAAFHNEKFENSKLKSTQLLSKTSAH